MKRIILMAAALSLMVSCQKDERISGVGSLGTGEFTGEIVQQSGTKTYLDSEDKVNWEASDRISINGAIYKITNCSGGTADFEYVSGRKPEEAPFYAFYPSDIQTGADTLGGSDSLGVLPLRWKYNHSTVRNLPMFAYSEDKELKFKNVFAAIKVSVPDKYNVRNITVESDLPMSGSFSISPEGHVTMISGAKTTTLYCGEDMGARGTDFYIAVPPADYSGEHLKVTVETYGDTDFGRSHVMEVRKDAEVVLKAGTIYEFALSDPRTEMDAVYQYFGETVASDYEYGYSPMFVVQNFCGDDVYASSYNGLYKSFEELNTFTYDVNNEPINLYFNGLINSIEKTNELIIKWKKDLKKQLTKATENNIKQCLAEVRVFRAYLHLNLAMGWAREDMPNFPFIDSTFSSGKPWKKLFTKKELLKTCASECENAVADLAERKGKTDKCGAAFITKGFAYAVAGKACLFAGDYGNAKTYLKRKVIESGVYDLVPGNKFLDLFHMDGDFNEEKIFQIVTRRSDRSYTVNNWRTSAFQADPAACYSGPYHDYQSGSVSNREGYGYGCIGYADGAHLQGYDGNSYRRKASTWHINDIVYANDEFRSASDWYEYDDPELQKHIDGGKQYFKPSNLVGIKSADGWNGESFWLPFKLQRRVSDYSGNSSVTIMRYAEVLLMYAEACVMTSDNDGLRYLNSVQERAGSKHKSTSANMIELKNEKRVELPFEGCRWFDIVRWNDAEAFKRLSTEYVPILCDRLHRVPKESDEVVAWDEGSMMNSRFYTIKGQQRQFKSGKHELFPIPTTFLAQHSDISQNPGWDE